MKLIETLGATSRIWQIFIADSSSTTGAGLTGLVFNSSSLTAYYHRDTDTTATQITLVTMTVGTFTSSGFKEIDATNMPGWYQLCPPNAVIASGAKSVALMLKGATNMAPLPIEVQLVGYDTQDSVRLGLTGLANATPGASGGLLIAGSNAATTFATLTSTGAFTINGTSDVAQTGDSFARIGATGSGLTSLAASATALSTVQWTNTRAGNLDNLDAAISTRMATYTQPTGFLAASFPLSVASPTNITAGTITTVSGNVNGSVASVTARVTANTDQLAGQTVTAAAGVTFPSSVASPTNITAGTITTVSGNVNGSVASVTNGVTLAANAVDSTAVATSGAQEIATAVIAASLGASNNNYTLGQGLTIVLSAVAGKVSGEDVGAPAFRDLADTKDVITGTDSGSGNRLTITYNP